jgi:putative tryptophan/tyrosine transport system substrate-binding protein
VIIRSGVLAAVLASSLLATPLAAETPTRGTPARIGILSVYARGNVLGPNAFPTAVPYEKLLQGAQERGYFIGQTVVLELRGGEGRIEQLDALAADFVQRNVDVLLTDGTLATQAAQRATRTIPIVMIRAGDPIAGQLIASLARPGGNITGVAATGPESAAKALQLLKEAVPQIAVVGVWLDSGNPAQQRATAAVEMVSPQLGVRVARIRVTAPQETEHALRATTRLRPDALLVNAVPIGRDNFRRLADFALKQRIPTMATSSAIAELGILMSFAADDRDQFRQAWEYIDKILRGARPADLPVQEPTKFETVINLKTAKTLGLTIPQSLLLRADRLIE